MDGIQRIQKEIHKKEDKLYCLANTNCKSVRRLAEAHALARIAEEEMISNGLMIITPWVMERGHVETIRLVQRLQARLSYP
jgi:hypothetical protein